MVAVSFLISIVLSIFIISLYFNKFDIIKTIVFAFNLFFANYVIVSGFYFWIDSFRFLHVLLTTIIIELICIVILYFLKYKITISFDIKKSIIPLIIVLIVLPITINNFEFFGMGQDQGVYQTKAIDLIYGKTKNQQAFTEVEYLSENEIDKFNELIRTRLVGFYRYDSSKLTLDEKDRLGPLSGIYHGIPTFPALLSLWGFIFGISDLMVIQTIFFIISIFMIYYTLGNFKLGYKGKFIGTFIFAISPAVLWVSKSALTEMYLCLTMLSYVYFLTSNNDSHKWLSAIAIATFSFFHVSIFAFMPIFVLIYAFFIVITGGKQYLISSIIAISSFMIGFTMMANVSPTYMFGNYAYRYPISKIVSPEFSLQFAYILSLVSIALTYIVYRSKKQVSFEKLKESRMLKNIIKGLTIIFLISIILHGMRIAFGYIEPARITQIYYYGSGLFAFNQLTLIGYMYNTGIILLPLVILSILFKTDKFLNNRNIFIILLLFLYCILFYSSFLKKEIPHYYYYSRYIVPFVPLITISAGIILDKISKYKIVFICMLVILINFSYIEVLYSELDDTRLEWDSFNRINESISKNSVVLMDIDLMSRLFFPIRAMNDVLVFPLSNNLDSDLKKMSTLNKEIFIISNDFFIKPSNDLYLVSRFDNDMSYDAIHKHPGIIPFPTFMNKSKETITIYEFEKEVNEYDFSRNSRFRFTGFYGLENNFRWTEGGSSYLELYLQPKNYILKIYQGPGIPFDRLERDMLKVELYMNGVYCDEVIVNKDNNAEILEFRVPKEAVNTGKNIMHLKSDTWSPSEYGLGDGRKLGISIDKIVLE